MNSPPLTRYLRPDDRLLLFDGECNLCHGLVRFLVRADAHRRILLATVQSAEGQAILRRCGLPTERFDSILYVDQRGHWLRSAAFFSGAEPAWLALAAVGVGAFSADAFGRWRL